MVSHIGRLDRRAVLHRLGPKSPADVINLRNLFGGTGNREFAFELTPPNAPRNSGAFCFKLGLLLGCCLNGSRGLQNEGELSRATDTFGEQLYDKR